MIACVRVMRLLHLTMQADRPAFPFTACSLDALGEKKAGSIAASFVSHRSKRKSMEKELEIKQKICRVY
jgi:hypothetical protein